MTFFKKTSQSGNNLNTMHATWFSIMTDSTQQRLFLYVTEGHFMLYETIPPSPEWHNLNLTKAKSITVISINDHT
jgi:hypothetical protein